MKAYFNRIYDKVLLEHLESKGAVLIEGAKWCGKTTTAKYVSKSFLSMDEPDKSKSYKELAKIKPSQLLVGDTPRLIDEWQLAPNLWNAVRYEVDQRDEFGQFILTGSAVPTELDESAHTGTGRIVRMKMRPMSLYESKESSGEVSLSKLFTENDAFGTSDMDIRELAYLICRGGWPKAIGLKEKVALRQAIDYYNGVVYEDVSRVDGVKRDKERTKRVLRSYARNVASQASLETIRQDIIANDSSSFNTNTLYSYLNALKNIFVIEESPSWNPNLRSKTAIRTTDTRYFVDPSIGAAALGVSPDDLINDLDTMGLLFENLCVRDLRIYSDAIGGTVYHYRDKTGLECDAVVHLRNGEYALIEVKIGGDSNIEDGAKNLIKLSNKIDTKKMKEPSFMMVLCGIAQYAYKREDGVIVVPINCLKD